MVNLDLNWTRQNPNFNTYLNDNFPSAVSVGNRIFVLYETNGNIRNGEGLKGESDIALFEIDLSGAVQNSYQKRLWNTTKKSFLSYQSIATDGVSLYFTYWTKGTIDNSKKTGFYDIVVVKTNLEGDTQWIIQDDFPNSTRENVWSNIEVDDNGNVYIVFTTNGRINTDAYNNNYPNMSLAIVKINGENGDILWTNQTSQINPEEGSVSKPSISVEGTNLFIGFSTSGSLPSTFKQSQSSTDVVLIKLDSTTGGVIWVKQDDELNSTLTNTSPIISAYQDNIYLTYSTSGVIQGDETIYKTTRTGNTDLVVARLNTNGDVLWLRQRENFNSIGNDTPYCIKNSDNGVFLTYSVTILAKNKRKLLRQDIVLLNLSEYGDIKYLKYDDFINYQSIGYIHHTPKFLLFNGGDTVFLCFGFSNFENRVIYNQQFNSTIFQTKGDLVLKRFDTSIVNNENDFKIWRVEGDLINTNGRNITPHIVTDSNDNVYTLFKTNGALPGYSLKGSYDISIFKTNKNGNIEWQKQPFKWNTPGKVTLSKQPISITTNNEIYIVYSSRNYALDGHRMKGIEDIILLKIDTDGNTLLTEQSILPNTIKRNSQPVITTDTEGNVIIAFITDGEVEDTQLLPQSMRVGRVFDLNIVLFKYDPINRNIIWTLQEPLLNSEYGSISQLNIQTIQTNIVLSYVSSGALKDNSKISNTSTDVILSNIDKDGNIVWVKQDSDLNSVLTNSMPTITTIESDIIISYNTSGLNETQIRKGSTDIIVARINPDTGNIIWKKILDKTNTFSQDTPSTIITDSSNNIYIASTSYRATIDNAVSQREDIIITKLTSTGDFIYAVQDDTFNKRIGTFRHVQPKIFIDTNNDIITVFSVSNFQIARSNKKPIIDRQFKLNRLITNETTSTQDDEDIVIVKTKDEPTTTSGEGNVTETNDGTGEVEEVAEPEEDPVITEIENQPLGLNERDGASIRLPIVLDSSANGNVTITEPPTFDYDFTVRMNTIQLNSSLFSSFINYVKSSENSQFSFTINEFVKDDFINALQNDIKNVKCELIKEATGLPEFSSGVPIMNNTLGVLFLQFFADVLFNHPLSQAPIRNDTEIIKNINEDSRLHEQFTSGITRNILERSDYIESSSQQKSDSRNPQLEIMLEQMFTQVSERFQDDIKDVPEIIPFEPGDELSMLIRMNGTVQLDEVQDFSKIAASNHFSQTETNNFLKTVLEGYNLDPTYVNTNTTNFIVSKYWRLIFVLS